VSHRKRHAAAAAHGGVGVVDGKAAGGQLVLKIHLRPRQQGQRNDIDGQARARVLDQQVISVRAVGQGKIVLKARAASAIDDKAQHLGPIGAEGQNPFGGGIGQGDRRAHTLNIGARV